MLNRLSVLSSWCKETHKFSIDQASRFGTVCISCCCCCCVTHADRFCLSLIAKLSTVARYSALLFETWPIDHLHRILLSTQIARMQKEILHTFCWFIRKICIRNCFPLYTHTLGLNSLNRIYVNRSFVCRNAKKSLLRCCFVSSASLFTIFKWNSPTFVFGNQDAILIWHPKSSEWRMKW